MTDKQTAIIAALRDGLPLTMTPYADLAERLGIAESDLLAQLAEWKESGVIRRLGAVLAHRKAGYSTNAMVVWDVPDERIEEIGAIAAGNTAVSHCYARPRFQDFPYNLYTMVHARSKDECEKAIAELRRLLGVDSYAVLYTLKEYKKTAPVYFAPRRRKESQ